MRPSIKRCSGALIASESLFKTLFIMLLFTCCPFILLPLNGWLEGLCLCTLCQMNLDRYSTSMCICSFLIQCLLNFTFLLFYYIISNFTE
jgi:hypothetical protein